MPDRRRRTHRSLALAVACCAASACNSTPTNCSTDVDCGDNAVCVEIETTGAKDKVKRCLMTCSVDRDCILSGRLGKSCRPIQDSASGPAAVEPRIRYGRANTDSTTRGTIRVCRDEKDGVR